jgi:hypothetical protein
MITARGVRVVAKLMAIFWIGEKRQISGPAAVQRADAGNHRVAGAD